MAVLDTAGTMPRDMIDRQVVAEVLSRGGRIGRWPVALEQGRSTKPYSDVDADGMDDRWEEAEGMDSARSDPWEDADGDGVSNFDEFLTHRLAEIAR